MVSQTPDQRQRGYDLERVLDYTENAAGRPAEMIPVAALAQIALRVGLAKNMVRKFLGYTH